MIQGIRHVGLVVTDIERSVRFYLDILGLKLVNRLIEEGHYIDTVVDINNVKLTWAKLQCHDGSIIELIQYLSHPDVSNINASYPSNRHGCSHVALTVDDIKNIYERIIDAGCMCNSQPQCSPDGKVKVMYCHDPDGIILEIVEELTK
jgi:catechol 2,3-dioxygenase-like lactoylglutathione lyase family enzyme